MKQVVIENPVINSPFDEPNRLFRLTDEGITNEPVQLYAHGLDARQRFERIGKGERIGHV